MSYGLKKGDIARWVKPTGGIYAYVRILEDHPLGSSCYHIEVVETPEYESPPVGFWLYPILSRWYVVDTLLVPIGEIPPPSRFAFSRYERPDVL